MNLILKQELIGSKINIPPFVKQNNYLKMRDKDSCKKQYDPFSLFYFITVIFFESVVLPFMLIE
jgi:hypothetical protein